MNYDQWTWVIAILLVVLLLGTQAERPANRGDAQVAPVRKVGNFSRAEGESYSVDNYTEVFLDGEAQPRGTLPEGAKLVKVQVDGRRVVRLFFERLK